MWSWLGLVASLALGVCAAAVGRRRTHGGPHDADTYGMTRRSHLRFACLCGAFAALFAAGAAWRALPAIPILGAFALASTLYATSFLRGFADEDGPM